jgi:hypothetical protein
MFQLRVVDCPKASDLFVSYMNGQMMFLREC